MIKRVGFKQSFVLFWKNYVNFQGRSTRSEYWFVALWMLIMFVPIFIMGFVAFLMIFFGIFGEYDGLAGPGLFLIILTLILMFILSLGILIPSYALLVRRFHDTGRTMVFPTIYFVVSVIVNVLSGLTNETSQSSNSVGLILNLIVSIVYFGMSIYVLVITCLPSEDKDNAYGPSPYVRHHAHGYDEAARHSRIDAAKSNNPSSNDNPSSGSGLNNKEQGQ